MKVLVSGAGGFLGQSVVNSLVERGHQVRAMVRPAARAPDWPEQVEVFRADLRVHKDLAPAFDGVDAVIHLAAAVTGNEDAQFASTVVATERFLEAMAKSTVKRLVHVSSLVVYDWSRAKSCMDEETPIECAPYTMGGYTIAKIWQERIVERFAQRNSWDITIARPGFIWGDGHEEIAAMGRKFGRLYLMFGPFTRLPLSHVTNCADCLVSALESPTASGQTFNIVDSDDVRVWQYVREYARRTRQPGLLVPLPYHVGLGLAQLAAFTSRKLFGEKGKLPSLLTPRRFESQFKPLRFSNSKIRTKLGWRPRFSFDECLAASYKHQVT
ncbi:putative UDP-glucose 4-epimerase (NAD-dependent epimerase/dehydratase) [Bradyrhizobium sp. STM 3843]|uniref:NAD-dependent epimerase/dehydratase family protein n=1 Tax=Bradyrhizobium sp. STM 3843 TaxID=551947 RepID=UPI000240533E|nr:NAD(P)-dependent oxidoreductase [Bradyrhizobium sp. STM 3843]CCE09378.1 putative UDP-glucose 4-epimerase (NAD-dependent epimerase/dehydratase) [Bradyrhizobium sp. STM 3843]